MERPFHRGSQSFDVEEEAAALLDEDEHTTMLISDHQAARRNEKRSSEYGNEKAQTSKHFTHTIAVALFWAKEQLQQRSWAQIARDFLLFLLPSFVQSRLAPETAPKRKLYPTSHLDGIRGLAAFLVVWHHLFHPFYQVQLTYGVANSNFSIFQLPIVNLLYSGYPWVSVFFVVSGYSLSIKPIKLMRAGQWEELSESLASSTFRRFFRLFLPCFASTFIVMWLLNLNFYEFTREFGSSRGWMRFGGPIHVAKAASWWDQFKDWASCAVNMVWVWSFELFGGRNRYDTHTWTIPVEFRGSLVLFLCQSAFSRKTPYLRMALFVAVAIFVHAWGRWDVFLFIAGPVLAEIDIILSAGAGWHSQSQTRPGGGRLSLFWVVHVFWIVVCLTGLFLLSFPEVAGIASPGFSTLSQHIPTSMPMPDKHRYWPMWGAIFYVAAINNLKLLASFFNTRFIQYLGRISFSIYLVHGPLHHTFGYAVYMLVFQHIFGFVPGELMGPLFNFAFGICFIINLAAIVWAADVFMRAVDIPSVKFAKWLDERGRTAD